MRYLNQFRTLGCSGHAKAVAFALACLMAAPVRADPLVNPPIFIANSITHVLDILMVAKTKPLSFPYSLNVTGWVYEVCPRPSPTANECPAGTSVQPLGGVRLALNKGDTLKVRLVNQLPLVPDSKHCSEPGESDLVNNPTNLHTHGLLVEPHRAHGAGDAYGDYVFLEVRNPANHGTCPSSAARPQASFPGSFKICSAASRYGVPGAIHPDMDVIDTAVEYSIPIPADHPSGLFWFHPHMHGIAMNQITSGMEGLITIGKVTDMCADAACLDDLNRGSGAEFLTLQDMQIDYPGVLYTQQNAGFCNGSSDPHSTSVESKPARPEIPVMPPIGNCLHAGKPGRWFHTVNGQYYPSITVGPHGGTWHILNASASRSYDLSLIGADGNPIPLQVLAVDGVTIDPSVVSDPTAFERMFGSKAQAFACTTSGRGVCVKNFKFMPSSRAVFRVVNPSTTAQQANFQTAEYITGAGGDDWPAISLASAQLAGAAPDSRPVVNVGGAGALLSDRGALGQAVKIRLPGTDKMVSPDQARSAPAVAGPTIQATLRQTPNFAIDPQLQTGARADAACAPLTKGHRRRIYFGYPDATNFGLGYVEIDDNGNEVAGTAKPVSPYDPTKATVCLSLAPGNKPVNEVWELVNLTAEDHNFHPHQSRFNLLRTASIYKSATSDQGSINEGFVVHDNIPLRHGTKDCDGTLATAQGGSCRIAKTIVRVTFGEVGDFVYHCHIMEHEDGGMMAKIRVLPNTGN